MAVTYLGGFEGQSAAIDNTNLIGTASISTAVFRTGAASLRCNPASGVQGNTSSGVSPLGFTHFGFRVDTLPSVARQMAGTSTGSRLVLNSSGTIEVFDSATSRGASTAVLATGAWYWIGWRTAAGTSVDLLQINGHTEVTGTVADAQGPLVLGFSSTEASAADAYYDDVIVDGAAFLPASSVNLLVPTADSAKGTGWTNDAAATTNLFDAVNNEPPAGIADTTVGSGLHQLRNATSNASVNYDATMTTYAAAGLTPQDTVLAVQPVIATAAPVTTSSKQGTVGVASNPTITNVALGSGGTAGAFWSGTAAGTYPTGWKISAGTLTTSPTVTVATAPVMRVTQVTSSTRIAMVCFMGIYVAWTPGALGVIDEPGVFPGRGPRNVNQGINRASSY